MTSSRSTHTRTVGLGCIALCTLLAAPAFAQRSATDIETARQLYNQGVELRDKGDMKGALEKLRAAHALGNTPITGVELCKTHAALAQPVEAREVCLGVGRIPPLAGETARSQDARNEAARIAEDMRPKISIVRLHVTGVPQGREPIVTVDGAPVPLAALGEARAVNPGKHDVSARVGSGAETRSQIDLAPGETKDIALPVVAPPPEPTPVTGPAYPPGGGERPPPKERSNGLATAGFVVGGVGLAIGAITGIVALSDKSDLEEKCTNKICGVSDHDSLDSAKRWGNVSTTFFIVGGVGLVVGLVATLSAPRSSSALAPVPPPTRRAAARSMTVTPDVGPGGVGIHGAF
ncbi:MAG: hypothetical protein JWP87_5125 [Labilithrix sp.]|nr:hypothetical protein [Labilithrix sp.]